MEPIKSKIPPQLQKDGLGFVKLKPRTKIPFEPDWQHRPYSFKEIQAWADQDNNYGVQGGYGGLIIIDADMAEVSDLVDLRLPGTFTVKTRKGFHYYYICEGIKNKLVLRKPGPDKKDIHLGEIMAQGSQVVGPGSVHPETGAIYQAVNESEIATVSREQILSELVEYIPTNFPDKDRSVEVSDLSVTDVLQKAGVQMRSVGNQLVSGHPVHGSTNKNNFVVSPDKNVWHCFRCDSGGGAIALIAVLERVIDCREAVPGGLRGDKFTQTLKLAQEKFGYMLKHGPETPSELVTEDRLLRIESRIQAIPADTPPARIPMLLDPILKEIAALNVAQGDAILRHTIKDHFGFTNEDLKSYEKVLKSYRKDSKESDERKVLSKDDVLRILEDEEMIRPIHPAQDFSSGLMSFAVKVQEENYLVASNKKLVSFECAHTEGFVLKNRFVDTARFSYKGIREFVQGEATVDIAKLYDKIFRYITRFIRFHKDAYPSYLTLWVMGTYVFMIFRYYPYVWLNAEKSSGKTLLMEVLSAVAFNGELLTNPTESVIFRDISNNLITMFIDEVEELRKRDKDAHGSLISVLNAGFNKSGVVKRCEGTGKGGFEVKAYSAYSPKMFAGINEIDDVLQDRTVRIPILRKKDNEVVDRYKGADDILELQREIRDELYIFALTYAKDIAEFYRLEGTDGIEGMEHLSNRELDIWEPIFLLANVVDAKRGNRALTDLMGVMSRESAKEKQSDSVSQNETYKILTVLKVMLDELVPINDNSESPVFEAEEVFKYFKKSEDFEWIEKTNVLTRRLKKVKVASEQRRINGEKKRVYILNARELSDLCERFKI